MVLTLVVAAVGGHAFTQRRMLWGYAITPADVPQLEALAARPAANARRVGVLTFDNLAVRWGRREQRLAVWVAG